MAIDDVTLYEVGAWDSVADIVGAACLVEALGPVRWQAGPVPLGGGRASPAHGLLLVPAPAILRHLVPEPGEMPVTSPGHPMRLDVMSFARLRPTGHSLSGNQWRMAVESPAGQKLAELHGVLDVFPRVAVAVSGGVDSMTLAEAAHRRLGAHAMMFLAACWTVRLGARDRGCRRVFRS